MLYAKVMTNKLGAGAGPRAFELPFARQTWQGRPAPLDPSGSSSQSISNSATVGAQFEQQYEATRRAHIVETWSRAR